MTIVKKIVFKHPYNQLCFTLCQDGQKMYLNCNVSTLCQTGYLYIHTLHTYTIEAIKNYCKLYHSILCPMLTLNNYTCKKFCLELRTSLEITSKISNTQFISTTNYKKIAMSYAANKIFTEKIQFSVQIFIKISHLQKFFARSCASNKFFTRKYKSERISVKRQKLVDVHKVSCAPLVEQNNNSQQQMRDIPITPY